MADQVYCTETTAKGTPCRRPPKKGETKCASHLGTAHRPTKLNEEITHRIVVLIQNGNYAETAARAAGISPTSYYSWRERGEADIEAGRDTEFAKFAEACARARAEAEATLLARIQIAAGGANGRPGDWRAAAWMLERMFPDKFGPQQRIEHTAGSGAPRRGEVDTPLGQERLSEVAEILASTGALAAASLPADEGGE